MTQITELTLIEYRERFKEHLFKWHINTENKLWYGKYHFRVEIEVPKTNWSIRKIIQNDFKNLDPHCRLRQETYLRFFTNSTTALDAILGDSSLLAAVKGFTTSNDQYITAIKNLDNIAVDVKLVSEIKYNPLIPYQVDFETYWGWVGGGQGSSKQSQRQNLLELYEFVNNNKDDLSVGYELNRWCTRTATGFETGYYYGAVRVYCRSGDNIPLLYMLFQDGIKKVYKLVKKESKA
jgi:hypothetical protein